MDATFVYNLHLIGVLVPYFNTKNSFLIWQYKITAPINIKECYFKCICNNCMTLTQQLYDIKISIKLRCNFTVNITGLGININVISWNNIPETN